MIISAFLVFLSVKIIKKQLMHCSMQQKNGLKYYLKEGKLFNQYQHPFQLKKKKVIKVKKEVITVADKSKEQTLNSLQEPCK